MKNMAFQIQQLCVLDYFLTSLPVNLNDVMTDKKYLYA